MSLINQFNFKEEVLQL